MVTMSEVKLAIATAIAAAFGFVIALLWRDVIIGYLQLAGLWYEGGFDTVNGALISTVVVIVITVICIFGILYISKWGGLKKE